LKSNSSLGQTETRSLSCPQQKKLQDVSQDSTMAEGFCFEYHVFCLITAKSGSLNSLSGDSSTEQPWPVAGWGSG